MSQNQITVQQASTAAINHSLARIQNRRQGQAVARADIDIVDRQLRLAQSVLDVAPDIISSTREIFTSAMETWQVVAELDVALEKYRIERTTSLERARVAAPIVARQLERMADRTDRVLDQIMAINSKTCSDADLQHRTGLMQTVRELSREITQVLMGLMRP